MKLKRILGLMLVLCATVNTYVSTVVADSNLSPIAQGIYNGRTYYIIDESMTWKDAKIYCEQFGGHLATITSEEEQNFVSGLIADGHKDFYWLGGTDSLSEGTWKWITDEPWDYSNWCENSPDNYGNTENYLGIIRLETRWASGLGKVNSWNDFAEEAAPLMGFVCECDNILSSFGSKISEWAFEEVEQAYDLELVPESLEGQDLTQPITRAEFATVSVKAYELMSNTTALPVTNNPFTDTNDVEVLKALNTGITIGVSDTEFAPDALLNREQAATMLTRVFKRATIKGWTIETDMQFKLDYDKPGVFTDDNLISSWAKDSVYFMAANGIINGVGENKFAPKNTTTEEEATGYANATREQALIIATRMVEKSK